MKTAFNLTDTNLFYCYSDDIRAAQRKIYFDLKENKRGVFLRISSTASYGASRQTIALPGQGISQIKECLSDFLEEFGQEEQSSIDLPEFKEMRIERKRFYFDCGSNDRGAFLRISEVKWFYNIVLLKTKNKNANRI